MREIKFRIFDKFLNKMYPPESLNGLYGDTSKEIRGNQIVMQFTGWLDENGKEIYDGDRVAIYWESDTTTEIISFDTKYGYWKYGNNPICELTESKYHIEVLGNIYENPEILQ